MSNADAAAPVSAAEARALFASLTDRPVLLVAVSGGPDSTALLFLLARWCAARRRGPKLIGATVDHGLRPEAAAEARAVARLARRLGVAHRILRWTGRKPKTGLQEAAREARYRLLADAARAAGAAHVVLAHTRDDQAETVLIRLARGSGMTGLRGMAAEGPMPGAPGLTLVRPLLRVPKARLLATLRRAGLEAAEDPSNRDPRFTRARLRAASPILVREGLTPDRLVLLADRLRRADKALEAAVDAAEAVWSDGAGPIAGLPDEVGLRLLGRAVARAGDEGAVELAKLEALWAAIAGARGRVRRTLAGALVTAEDGRVRVERAPARRRPPKV